MVPPIPKVAKYNIPDNYWISTSTYICRNLYAGSLLGIVLALGNMASLTKIILKG